MSQRIGVVGCALFVIVCFGVAAQTPKNPISTKPEGTAPTCSYTGSITDGKPSSSNTCTGTVPGADPNQIVPLDATKRFPFPGETPETPAPAPQTNAPAADPANPAVPAGKSAVSRFPFPGETPDNGAPGSGTPANAAAPAPNGPPLHDAGSSGSSSSSSSSSSQADPGFSSSNPNGDPGALPDDDPTAPLPTPRRNARKKLPPVTKPVTPEEQEAEDVQIAGFYQNDGNYKAAYERAKEAVGLDANDPDAHLALADAARKLGKLDEAETNYKKTLTLDPVPKTRKAVERALKEMSGA